jgi:hypothetical protein
VFNKMDFENMKAIDNGNLKSTYLVFFLLFSFMRGKY